MTGAVAVTFFAYLNDARRAITAHATGAAGVGPLPELLRLRDAYGCYLIVDESLSFGTLGPLQYDARSALNGAWCFSAIGLLCCGALG